MKNKKMMKRILGLLLFAALLVPAQNLSAQALKFGHINQNDIITSMPEYDTAMKQYSAYGQELSNALELMQVEYNNKLDKYQQETKTLTDIVKQNREQELQDMLTRIQTFQQTAQQKMQDKQQELMNPIVDKANKAINDVAKEGGFIYIYDTRSLVYFDPAKSVDITALVKTKLGIKK